MDGHKSIDKLIAELIRNHKLSQMNDKLEPLRDKMKEVADVSSEHLVQRLNLSPFKN